MFLFLSKLLPLFVYPLGLITLLLVASLVLLWKRPRWAAATLILALVILLASGNYRVSAQMVRSLEWQHLPPAPMPNAEAIVVLGGAIKPATSPRPWIDVSEAGDRVLHGVQLYQAGKAPLIIFSGGRIEWIDTGERPESTDMAELAMAMGVPEEAILEDPTSLNTYQNAVNVKTILEERNIQRILLVTSAIHMPRSVKIFEKQGIETIPAPTDFLMTVDTLSTADDSWQGTLLGFIPQVEPLDHVTRVLKEYIGIQVYRLRGWL